MARSPTRLNCAATPAVGMQRRGAVATQQFSIGLGKQQMPLHGSLQWGNQQPVFRVPRSTASIPALAVRQPSLVLFSKIEPAADFSSQMHDLWKCVSHESLTYSEIYPDWQLICRLSSA